MARLRRSGAALVLSLVVAGLVGACANDTGDTAATTGSDGGSSEVADMEAPAGRSGYNVGSAGGGGASGDDQSATLDAGGGGGGMVGALAQAPDIGPSVIKTASVTIEVDEDRLSEATRDAIAIAGRNGGFVLSTSTDGGRAARSRVVVRVPAEAFESALAALEDLGDVKTEEISGQDVGQEFVDLEARIRNLEAQEAVLLRLMERSTSVTDSIKVQRELQGVQLEIEKLTGRLRYLRDQADMATISLSIAEVGAPGHKPPTGVIAKAWERALDVALGVVAAVIVGTGFLVPVAALALMALLLLKMVRPRLGSQP